MFKSYRAEDSLWFLMQCLLNQAQYLNLKQRVCVLGDAQDPGDVDRGRSLANKEQLRGSGRK